MPISLFNRSILNTVPNNNRTVTMSENELMPMQLMSCALSPSTMHPLLGSTSKSSLKSPQSDNSNVAEAKSISHHANDLLFETTNQVTGLHPTSLLYSSPTVINQQPLNMFSNNSISDPMLSSSSMKHHRINDLDIVEDQPCANDTSPGECHADGVPSPLSFYLSPTLNFSSNSSSSDSDVSIFLFINNYIHNHFTRIIFNI